MSLLLEYYQNMWNNTDVAKKYWQCGANDYGNILWFMNTNFRTIAPAFYNAYVELKDEVGHRPSEFAVVASHGQTKVKQLTVRMRQTWLYFLDGDGKYKCSRRGQMFEKAMENNMLSPQEKDLVCFLFLLAAEFNNTAKYLFRRTNECFQYYQEAGFTVGEILALQRSFIINSQREGNRLVDLANEDYFYIANLYRPYRQTNFLSEFKCASDRDKDELKSYVRSNMLRRASNCILSKKYELSGNFNKPMIVECAWILYITKKVLSLGVISYEEFVHSAIRFYGELFVIEQKKVLAFIKENNEVFESIYNTLYDVAITGEQSELSNEEIEGKVVVDPTDIQGQARQNQVSEVLKQMAKERSNYHCILEDSEDCSGHYFTSKKENQNYVEVHHFIPREFASEFDHTIEILDNYVTLCPCCHRKIHHATDRERRHMILEIYNQRKGLLEKRGIQIPSTKKLLEFYKFDQVAE